MKELLKLEFALNKKYFIKNSSLNEVELFIFCLYYWTTIFDFFCVLIYGFGESICLALLIILLF